MKSISERVWKSDQSWNFERVSVLVDLQRLRCVIKRDAYDFQSYGKVERWDGDKWQIVLTRSIGELDDEVTAISYVQARVSNMKFHGSALAMERAAMLIVLKEASHGE